jgi:hypothetical protein
VKTLNWPFYVWWWETTVTEPTPLQALADCLATPKEIKRLLDAKVQGLVDACLQDRLSSQKARDELRRRLRTFLDSRGFARFGRKKLLDKVIAKAMREGDYSFRLRAAQRADEREAKREEKHWNRYR